MYKFHIFILVTVEPDITQVRKGTKVTPCTKGMSGPCMLQIKIIISILKVSSCVGVPVVTLTWK